jgi:NDP-sugar pyrophosphorylase family protein
MKAFILAAGKSTRIAGIAKEKPKPLLEVLGTPVIVHNIQLLRAYGITELWVNLHYHAEQIQACIGDGSRWGVSVKYSFESELLGTAGAIKKIEEELKRETFLVLYGDNFSNCNLQELLVQHQQKKSLATIAVFDATKNVNSGIAGGRILMDTNHQIQRFIEGEGGMDAAPWVNAGIYALEPEILEYIPTGFSDFGKDIFPNLLEQKRFLHAYRMHGFCLALDTPESFANAQKLAQTVPYEN